MPKHSRLPPRDEMSDAAATFQATYAKLRAKLEETAAGQYVVINVRTTQHVVGSTPETAMNEAEKVFGSTDHCWSKRIGAL